MLYRAFRTTTIESFEHRRRHFPRNKRVFAEILKIASVERIAVDIATRSQKHVDVPHRHFFPDSLVDVFHQRCVPSASKQSADWNERRFKPVVAADSRRTVRTANRGNTKMVVQSLRKPAKRACNASRDFSAHHSLSANNRHQFRV